MGWRDIRQKKQSSDSKQSRISLDMRESMERIEPNERQKRLLLKHDMNPEHWLVLEEDKYQIVFISKRRSRRRTIEKRRSSNGREK